MSTMEQERELKALEYILRVMTKALRNVGPSGRRWLRDRLNAVELRDV